MMSSPRRFLNRPFPSYAYLPGLFPHPLRDPAGHSHHLKLSHQPDQHAFVWGMDLFNYGYYWEAHEAWEDLWRATERPNPWRDAMKGLILLAAAGLKLRERKLGAARRHGKRAAAMLRSLLGRSDDFARMSGWDPMVLATRVEASVETLASARAQIVFDIVLG